MSICTLITRRFPYLQGGPIIMASNAQQQQQLLLQCTRKQRQRRQQQQHQLPIQQQQHYKQQQQLHLQQQQQQQQQQQRVPKPKRQQQQRHEECTPILNCNSGISAYFSSTLLPSSFSFPFPLPLRTINNGKLLYFGVLLQLLLLLALNDPAYSEGNVGCHFVRTLCLEGSEVCFDDNIFGKCIPTTGVDVEDIEKRPLTEDQTRTLSVLLEELQGAGLGWDHPYVQCRIQGMLFSLQRQTPLPPNLCANLVPTVDEMDPVKSMAIVRFKPPEEDLLYYPPLKKQTNHDGINTIFHQLQLQDRQSRHDPLELAHFGKLDEQGPQLHTSATLNAFLENERARLEREQMERERELEQEAQAQAQAKNAMRNRIELYKILAASEPDPEPYQRNAPTAMEKLEQVMERESAPVAPIYVPEDINDSNELYFQEPYINFKRTGGRSRSGAVVPSPDNAQRSFFRELAGERALPQAAEPFVRPDYYGPEQMSAPVEDIFIPTNKRGNDDMQSDAEENLQRAFEQSLIRNSLTPFEEEAMLASNSYPRQHMSYQSQNVYTEGGIPYRASQGRHQQINQQREELEKAQKQKARALLENMFGFTRHERLDVKKPGPLTGPPANELELSNRNKTSNSKNQETKEVLPQHVKGSNEAHKKKKVVKDHSEEDHGTHTVDTEYAHVKFKNNVDNWSDGVRIMNELANILHMQGYFTYLTVQPHEVSFRVDSNNPERKTASDVARFINENSGLKKNILRRLGVNVETAGVGDKTKSDDDGGVSSARIELAEQGPDVTHIMAYMFAGAGAAAVVVIFVTLILIKRHDKKRDKLGGLQSGAAGAESCSKDYQDLCRARMAGKGSTSEAVPPSGRITSLSKENDRPPSSRSSTSSWSEEPALTNMDISTGHMVLSYMEDHLRNKGRLQREWEALCRYEAEPSAREAAQQPQCATLNRTGAPLPYDHSRVVLNHLANAEGLDYINASTITDHDPRAPAYVAAQGPLPTTLAHFWQMIWEQGAVVIVALCRLQENGEIACARYWPEEGAEVYHIYEVHLVSEHIWCDDYLVRSFYLKNLRTSETRTVTQFHFLSWPQGGVPTQAKALLDFRRKVNKSYRGRSCPIVVHGSSGAGRTGAYILLDLVLGRMNKGAREIDIAATLEHLRDQRAGLVATRQQFEFVLMAVAEEVHAILKALPANQSNEKRDLDVKDTAGATGTLKEEETIEEQATSTKAAAETEMLVKQEKEKHTEKDVKAAATKGSGKKK